MSRHNRPALRPTALEPDTARAMELGALEGVICGLVIGVMGIMTATLIPIVEQLLELQQQRPTVSPPHPAATITHLLMPHEHIREMHTFK